LISTGVNQRRHAPLRTLTDRERTQVVADAIGPSGPLAKRKAFTRADVIRVVAPSLYGCAVEELDRSSASPRGTFGGSSPNGASPSSSGATSSASTPVADGVPLASR
jgi:hypothetical protein